MYVEKQYFLIPFFDFYVQNMMCNRSRDNHVLNTFRRK